MKTPDQVKELYDCVCDGEIDWPPHAQFIMDVYKHLDPKNWREELSEWTCIYIDFLHEKYTEEIMLEWVDYLEEAGLYEAWDRHRKDKHEFLEKYGLVDEIEN